MTQKANKKKNKAPIPNFFIIGAPRTGTTALHEYLRQHPDIFVPYKKEIHYFGTDLSLTQYNRNIKGLTEEKYLSFFKNVKNETAIGEASVWYLFSKEAAKEIYKFNPESRIIIMLRNPVEMIYSLHRQNVYGKHEHIVDFKKALKAEPHRKKGLKLTQTTFIKESGLYTEIALYYDQVRRYIEVFPRNKIKIIIFNDFKNNTKRIYQEVLEFLEVDYTFQIEHKIINPNKEFKIKFFENFIRNMPDFIKIIFRIVLPDKRLRRKLWCKFRDFNTQYKKRSPLNSQLRKELTKKFEEDVIKLEKLLNIDLSTWRAC